MVEIPYPIRIDKRRVRSRVADHTVVKMGIVEFSCFKNRNNAVYNSAVVNAGIIIGAVVEISDEALGELKVPYGIGMYAVEIEPFKSNRFCGVKILNKESAIDERAGGASGGVGHHACTAHGDGFVDVTGVEDPLTKQEIRVCKGTKIINFKSIFECCVKY